MSTVQSQHAFTLGGVAAEKPDIPRVHRSRNLLYCTVRQYGLVFVPGLATGMPVWGPRCT